jgi:hypothetical protein
VWKVPGDETFLKMNFIVNSSWWKFLSFKFPAEINGLGYQIKEKKLIVDSTFKDKMQRKKNEYKRISKREEGRENGMRSPCFSSHVHSLFLASISLQTGREVRQAHTSRSLPTSRLKIGKLETLQSS